MTDPAEGKAQDSYENEKAPESATNAVVDMPDEVDPDDSKAHLISANGGAGGDVDRLPDVKVMDGTATSSEAEVSFNGLGKDEVMKYADEPFWKRLRLILFILFWLGWFAMLVTAIIIIVLAPRCPPRPDLKWYQKDVIYEVLPESFKDSNGDGKGDFKGLKEKAGYIFDKLDTKAIWLNSIYETDGLDSGLGIIDHKALAPWFNASVDDVKAWIKSQRKDEKRVILDLIPNQTSKKHEWFLKSQKKEGKYKDYYVWAPNTNGSPPNNWESVYGGSAWELDPVRNEYYLHQFSKDHPDLNLLNSDVMDEIKDIMRFWLDAGVSGFNVRGVEYLAENKDLTDNVNGNSSQTEHYVDSLGILEELRKVVDSFSDKPGRERVLFATVRNPTQEVVQALWGPPESKRLHIVVGVPETLNKDSQSTDVKSWFEEVLSDDRYQWYGSALGSMSVSRIATRMSTPKKLTIAHALQMLLPGTPFNYYGDEFGQKDGAVPQGKTIDKHGRDNFRTPMQWTSGVNAGFTSGTPYLPIGADYKINHVEASDALFAEVTPLKFFKQLVELRQEESFQFGKTKVCAPDSNLLLFTRQAERFPYFLTLINMGSTKKSFKLDSLECVTTKEMGTIRFHSRDVDVDEKYNFKENAVWMEAGDVVVVEFSA